MSENFAKYVKRILNETNIPGEEHERLKEVLGNWAKGLGFSIGYASLPSGLRPDVLKSTSDKKYIFVGDAKDANNETVHNQDTLSRISNYILEYATLLTPNRHAGGIFAIATNSAEAAVEWGKYLNIMTNIAKISGGQGLPPDYKVIKIDEKAWIVYW
ncbi:MAG TPA: hypothetical protein PLW78_09490 [bacterium]|nr:hypothetical protein [bacterium]